MRESLMDAAHRLHHESDGHPHAECSKSGCPPAWEVEPCEWCGAEVCDWHRSTIDGELLCWQCAEVAAFGSSLEYVQAVLDGRAWAGFPSGSKWMETSLKTAEAQGRRLELWELFDNGARLITRFMPTGRAI